MNGSLAITGARFDRNGNDDIGIGHNQSQVGKAQRYSLDNGLEGHYNATSTSQQNVASLMQSGADPSKKSATNAGTAAVVAAMAANSMKGGNTNGPSGTSMTSNIKTGTNGSHENNNISNITTTGGNPNPNTNNNVKRDDANSSSSFNDNSTGGGSKGGVNKAGDRTLMPRNVSDTSLSKSSSPFNAAHTTSLDHPSHLASLNPSASSKPLGGSAHSNSHSNKPNPPPGYWSAPIENITGNTEDLVVIHVCDETRQISKDFCCKRDILVKHMKYFEKFLQENDTGYEDIDISVHCDVEIFEWLMTYIHEPDRPPQLEKTIVVSLLISSEFLQMETLVEHCLLFIANTLNETIRLPIDLSCISDRTINRLAAMTHPKTLAHTKDRKDKILNKLYKRRVELDFSRKSGSRGGVRTIAASLTCCRYCGVVYLDNWVSMLHCPKSPVAIDFHGRLTKRHSAISGWSLTAYLKALHGAGMNWDAIYWHVWASCQVFKVHDFMISILETDRFKIEPDGLLIYAPAKQQPSGGGGGGTHPGGKIDVVGTSSPGGTASSSGAEGGLLPPLPSSPDARLPFCLSIDEEDTMVTSTNKQGAHAGVNDSPKSSNSDLPTTPLVDSPAAYKLFVTHYECPNTHPQITFTLNPNRPAEILPPQIYELICTQIKYVSSLSNRAVVDRISHQVMAAANMGDSAEAAPYNYQLLWVDLDGPLGLAGSGSNGTEGERGRGRSRSPQDRKGGGSKRVNGSMLSSKSQPRSSKTAAGTEKGRSGNTSDGRGASGSSRDGSVDSKGSDSDVSANEKESERKKSQKRSRSMGAGFKQGSAGATPKSKVEAESYVKRVTAHPGERKYKGLLGISPSLHRKLSIYKSTSPEIMRKASASKGSCKGVWLQPHPLLSYPIIYSESLNGVKESNLSESKKLEWTIDLIREFDDKRLDRFENFLSSHRSPSNTITTTSSNHNHNHNYNVGGSSKGNTGNRGAREVQYYRDKGRQPQNIYPSSANNGIPSFYKDQR